MEEFVGGGDLLGHLDEVFDSDMRLSLDLDFDMKDSFSCNTDEWNTWGTLRSSPAFDLLGEKDGCIMVPPHSVMPCFKREIKQKLPSPTKEASLPKDRNISLTNGFSLECETEDKTEIKSEDISSVYDEEEEGEDNEEEVEEEEEEEEDDDDGEEADEYEEEEEHVEEIKLQPKDKRVWNNVSHTTMRLDNTSSPSYIGRQKTEIVVPKSPSVNMPTAFISKAPSNLVTPQTLKVLHATKKSNSTDSSPVTSHSRSLLVNRRYKDNDGYPKPAYSYSCLIAMALKNSTSGSLPVSEIYNFMCEHFPYFKSAPSGWKNSVRHNLSLNKCFEKIEKGNGGSGCRKGCLWAMNPSKVAKMDDEVAKWSKKDPIAIRRAMKNPEELESLERGDLKIGVRRESADSGAEEDDSDDSSGSISDSDTEEVPPSLKRFDSRLSSQESNDLGLPDEMYEELGYLEEVMSSDTEIDLTPAVKRVRLGLDPHPRQHVRPV